MTHDNRIETVNQAWHKSMKKKNPEKYYSMQYSKFKKIGEYKHMGETKIGPVDRLLETVRVENCNLFNSSMLLNVNFTLL